MGLSDRLALVLEEARAARRPTSRPQQHANLPSAAGVVAGFLAALVLRDHARWTVWSCLALGSFGFVALLVVFVHWPRKVIFSNDPRKMLDEWDLDNREDNDTTRLLAGFLADNVKTNQKIVDQITWAFAASMGFFSASSSHRTIVLSGSRGLALAVCRDRTEPAARCWPCPPVASATTEPWRAIPA